MCQNAWQLDKHKMLGPFSTSDRQLKIRHSWQLQQENDLKHTPEQVSFWIKQLIFSFWNDLPIATNSTWLKLCGLHLKASVPENPTKSWTQPFLPKYQPELCQKFVNEYITL